MQEYVEKELDKLLNILGIEEPEFNLPGEDSKIYKKPSSILQSGNLFPQNIAEINEMNQKLNDLVFGDRQGEDLPPLPDFTNKRIEDVENMVNQQFAIYYEEKDNEKNKKTIKQQKQQKQIKQEQNQEKLDQVDENPQAEDSEDYNSYEIISKTLINKEKEVYLLEYKNGDSYKGELNENDEKEGLGVYTYSNGEVYDGLWEEDQIHGYGDYTFQGGQTYQGDWKFGVKHGYGKLVLKPNECYFGNFMNDEFEGYGVLNYANGDFYDGYWKNGKKNGQGKFRTADGWIRIGEWKDNELQQF